MQQQQTNFLINKCRMGGIGIGYGVGYHGDLFCGVSLLPTRQSSRVYVFSSLISVSSHRKQKVIVSRLPIAHCYRIYDSWDRL